MDTPVPGYRTVAGPTGPAEIKERKSKFLGYAFPVATAEAAERQVAELWKVHPDATHICYAYRVDPQQHRVRVQDDGEPTHSAGAPILNQIESWDLCNVLVCVVRYYGGTKLGVGGLIQAYRGAARACLEQARLVDKKPRARVSIRFGYENLDAVLRLLDQHPWNVVRRQMDLGCFVEIEVNREDLGQVRGAFAPLNGVVLRISATGS